MVVKLAAGAVFGAALLARVERAARRAARARDRHASVLVRRARWVGQADAEQPLGAKPEPLEQRPHNLEREVLEESVKAQDFQEVAEADDPDDRRVRRALLHC